MLSINGLGWYKSNLIHYFYQEYLMSKIIKKDNKFRIYNPKTNKWYKRKFDSEIEAALFAKKATYGMITIKNFDKQWVDK
jgi:hypothetical protein